MTSKSTVGYDTYLKDSNNNLVNLGRIVIYGNKILFERSEHLRVEQNDKYKLHHLMEVVNSVNRDGSFNMPSDPPDNYIYEIVFDENGVKQIDDNAGSWSRIVNIKDSDFKKYLKKHLFNYEIILERKDSGGNKFIPSDKERKIGTKLLFTKSK